MAYSLMTRYYRKEGENYKRKKKLHEFFKFKQKFRCSKEI